MSPKEYISYWNIDVLYWHGNMELVESGSVAVRFEMHSVTFDGEYKTTA